MKKTKPIKEEAQTITTFQKIVLGVKYIVEAKTLAEAEEKFKLIIK